MTLTATQLAGLSNPEQLAKLTPVGFARYASRGKWQFARHLHDLHGHLLRVASGQCRRLIISMPPRHGKSQFASYFVAWYLGTFPERRVVLASYAHSLASNFGQSIRDVLSEYGPTIFGVGVADTNSARDDWRTVRVDEPTKPLDGGLYAVGVGSGVTGRGADLLLIDDPHKDAEEAASQTMRDRAHDWWRSTAYTRLSPTGAVIVIQTRWHEDDLTGRLIAETPDDGSQPWEVVRLPAIAEDGDPLGRKRGAALWPERFSISRLDEIRRELGSYFFAALYQQSPQPAEGALFKVQHFRRYVIANDVYQLRQPDGAPTKLVPVNTCRRFATVDLAISEKSTADWTVAATWDATPDNDLILVDVSRARMEDGHEAMIEQVYEKHKPAFMAIENVAFQAKVVNTMRRRGLPVRSIRPDRDKVSRALMARARYESGAVYHPVAAHWLGEFEAELLGFPTSSKHDDQVDATSMAALIVADKLFGGGVAAVQRPAGWQ